MLRGKKTDFFFGHWVMSRINYPLPEGATGNLSAAVMMGCL